jgi:outer membrane protein assembly factor BamD (BamD/ComL family)
MTRRILLVLASCVLLLPFVYAEHPSNSAAKQPDQVMFDHAMHAMKAAHYADARAQMKELLTTYQDSALVPRAKLSIADAWFAEGYLTQAHMEYQDFVTFFPKRPETSYAQTKINWIEAALKHSR